MYQISGLDPRLRFEGSQEEVGNNAQHVEDDDDLEKIGEEVLEHGLNSLRDDPRQGKSIRLKKREGASAAKPMLCSFSLSAGLDRQYVIQITIRSFFIMI